MNPDKTSRWWQEPMVWMIAALPLSAVIGAVASAVIAFKHQDSLVNEDVHKLGLATTVGKDREDKAANLGLSASLRMDQGRIEISLSGHIASWPDALKLRLVHPTRAGQDQDIRLLRVDAAGHYGAASISQVEIGRRLLILEPADASWRLVGTLQSPARGETQLAAGTRNPPTHL